VPRTWVLIDATVATGGMADTLGCFGEIQRTAAGMAAARRAAELDGGRGIEDGDVGVVGNDDVTLPQTSSAGALGTESARCPRSICGAGVGVAALHRLVLMRGCQPGSGLRRCRLGYTQADLARLWCGHRQERPAQPPEAESSSPSSHRLWKAGGVALLITRIR